MFVKGKPNIVLKTVKGFDTKITLFRILILENSLKFGIVVPFKALWLYGPGS